MLRVCRTCLQKIPDSNCVSLTSSTESVEIKTQLTLCVPEMVLDSVAESVICTFCTRALNSAYVFKRRCLQTEECIQNYLYLNPEPLILSNVPDLEAKYTSLNEPEVMLEEPENKFEIKEELPLYSDEEVKEDDYKITDECLGFPINLTASINEEDSESVFQMVQKDKILEKPYQCTDCNYKSAEKSKLKRHLLTHNAVKPFKCTICDFDTTRKDTLTIHMREHSGEKPYPCLCCEFKAVSKYALNMHCMQMHGEKKPHKCPKCKYSAVERSTLRRHMAVHSSEKPFKCDQCNFSTAWKYTWAKHMQGHSGMNYKCDLCDYSTIYKHNLSLHSVRHSGEKPFKCNKCDYKAAEKSKLKRHVLTHGSVKPFICSICNFGTTRNDTLKKHLTSHKRNHIHPFILE